MDYFRDSVDRSVMVVRGGEWGPWSTGEKLVVALVLMDWPYLEAEGYSYSEAMNRVASGVGVDRAELPLWLDSVRVTVDEEVAEVAQ